MASRTLLTVLEDLPAERRTGLEAISDLNAALSGRWYLPASRKSFRGELERWWRRGSFGGGWRPRQGGRGSRRTE